MHDETAKYLEPPQIEPFFVESSKCKTSGMARTDPLVLSKSGKAMNKPLSEIQLALVTETVAGCTVQGLGRYQQEPGDDFLSPPGRF